MTETVNLMKLTCKQLREELKKRHIGGYSNKRKNELIKLLENSTPMPSNRCRKNNGSNETKDLEVLGQHFITRTELGRSIISSLEQETGIKVKSFISRRGNRSSHYDFILTDTDGRTHRVEYKGGSQHKQIHKSTCPWKSGVQFYNGPANKFTFGIFYAKLWFNHYIKSGVLNDMYNLQTKPPTWEEWEKDCFRQDSPRTPWGIEFKSTYQVSHPKSSPLHLRYDVNRMFVERWTVDKNFRDTTLDEIELYANNHIQQKDLWLQLNSSNLNADTISTDCYYQWYPKLPLLSLKSIVSITWERSDIELACDFEWHEKCNIEIPNIKARLRWGKGVGFSNMRIDLK